MLRKILPHPGLSALLILTWLLLVNDFKWGSLVFATILAICIPWLTAPFWPDRPVVKNWLAAAEFVLIVLYDIVKSNITVALIVLFKPKSQIHPLWVTVPLDLRTPEAITVLAGTITMTPGTVTADMSADGRSLLVHCLDATDADAIRDDIKSRYETRLMRIFE
ncbi:MULTISPECIES: Na+/H+ antiporter subunit E [Gemmobacter]|jgi:multicomponent K+:H+ antiporter subunit E|uniref:Multisubunit potassium/proton antiporter PhaE subunit n=2 Tax=Gemmobacter TaxID=204456 RepID=A0A2T6ASH6_9RHOB|nr:MULTISPECIES: Na+/H+ antiporter subunit E [Gemmobacter]OJY25521.1 MAG: Na+/H+ antiporter subunit E [Rhodobacterales bacterium 65-51]PTX46782.1 multisubunit potassium/proton antiporter PhaE subunit [Gemmobacter caeni]TWI95744.1 multisubunit potassium/proton antiporter PhaE subunit [Gemmobacter caeni]GHC23797.1 Na+/H+ antiporter subunit E [Gemmobacter nanjingensis]